MEDGGGGCGGGGDGGGGGGDSGCSSDSGGGGDSNGSDSSFVADLAERISHPDVYTPTVDVTGSGSGSRSEGIRRTLKRPQARAAATGGSPGVFTPLAAVRRREVEDASEELRRSVDAYERKLRKGRDVGWLFLLLALLAILFVFWFKYGR